MLFSYVSLLIIINKIGFVNTYLDKKKNNLYNARVISHEGQE